MDEEKPAQEQMDKDVSNNKEMYLALADGDTEQ